MPLACGLNGELSTLLSFVRRTNSPVLSNRTVKRKAFYRVSKPAICTTHAHMIAISDAFYHIAGGRTKTRAR